MAVDLETHPGERIHLHGDLTMESFCTYGFLLIFYIEDQAHLSLDY